MKMRQTIFCTALSIAWGGCALGQEADFVSPLLQTFEAGVLCGSDSGVVREAPDTVSGTTHVVEEMPPFVSNGRMVPAVIGIGFGARFGLPGNDFVGLATISVTHPPFAGNGATRQSYQTYLGSEDDPGISYYQFDYPYELALGEWTMTATSSGATLYEITFTVVPPSAIPELAGLCGYQDLLS